jgi:hypothetical protein
MPAEAEVISPDLALVLREGKVILFNAAGPIYEYGEDDHLGVRLAAAVLADLGLAPVTALAAAFGVDRATVHRDHARLEDGGVGGLLPRKRGPKGPHKLTGAVLARAQGDLDDGGSLREAGSRAGAGEFAVRRALKRGLLRRSSAPASASPAASAGESLAQPAERAAKD